MEHFLFILPGSSWCALGPDDRYLNASRRLRELGRLNRGGRFSGTPSSLGRWIRQRTVCRIQPVARSMTCEGKSTRQDPTLLQLSKSLGYLFIMCLLLSRYKLVCFQELRQPTFEQTGRLKMKGVLHTRTQCVGAGCSGINIGDPPRTTLSISEKEVRPERRFGPNFSEM